MALAQFARGTFLCQRGGKKSLKLEGHGDGLGQRNGRGGGLWERKRSRP